MPTRQLPRCMIAVPMIVKPEELSVRVGKVPVGSRSERRRCVAAGDPNRWHSRPPSAPLGLVALRAARPLICNYLNIKLKMAHPTGFEPVTSAFGEFSLSYDEVRQVSLQCAMLLKSL